MLTEAITLNTRWRSDSPWRRLPWSLPSALLILSAALFLLAYFMGKPAPLSTLQPPIDARFIEEATPSAPPNINQRQPVALHQPKPVATVLPQHTEQKAEVTPKNVVVAAPPSIAPGSARDTSNQGPSPATANTDAKTGAQVVSRDEKNTSGGNMYANSGAWAVFRPMPQIPDDLREKAFKVAAPVRFYVAIDGSAKVELVKPTPDPRINRIVLDSLKKWRFMPAIKNGKPVASIFEMVFKFEVK